MFSIRSGHREKKVQPETTHQQFSTPLNYRERWQGKSSQGKSSEPQIVTIVRLNWLDDTLRLWEASTLHSLQRDDAHIPAPNREAQLPNANNTLSPIQKDVIHVTEIPTPSMLVI